MSDDYEILRKVCLINIYQVEDLILWLETMNHEGYELKSYGYFWCDFIKTNKKVAYCLSKNQNKEFANQNKKDHYTWQIITNVGDMSIYKNHKIARNNDEMTNTSFTEHELVYGKKYILKNMTHKILAMCVFLAIMVGVLMNLKVLGRTLYLTATMGWYAIAFGAMGHNLLVGLLNYKALKQSENNIDLIHFEYGSYKKTRNGNLIYNILLISAIALVIALALRNSAYTSKIEGVIPSDYDGLRIENIVIDDFTYIETNKSWLEYNTYRKRSTLLVPKQEFIDQIIRYRTPKVKDGETYEESNLFIKRYVAINDSIAGDLIRTLKESFGREKVFESYKSLDDLWYFKHGRSVELLARKGKVVYDIKYYGGESIDQVIDWIENNQ